MSGYARAQGVQGGAPVATQRPPKQRPLSHSRGPTQATPAAFFAAQVPVSQYAEAPQAPPPAQGEPTSGQAAQVGGTAAVSQTASEHKNS